MFSINAGMSLLVMFLVCSVTALNNKTCETPDNPENGFVTINEDDPTLAVYSCSSGYVMSGKTHRVCESNGQWKGSAPDCRLETTESSSHLSAIIGGIISGSVILAVAATVIIYLIKKRDDGNREPCISLNCHWCPRNRDESDRRVVNHASFGDGYNGQQSSQLSLPYFLNGNRTAAIKELGEY
ncbi:CUB and sushi domain-containing protein 3-like [Ruditapes philippinarum]|uniref:CUB and sushi domain-containing protein 3-like n=1 Tax=Ruditapes philippinarum TaxID=129788 RepID=UPI00295BB458|nr:CUB and sushi domain-containing protein 3-like [Ruditapes philippinarum]XP_060589852.1 CUB and sushi domain-containing protein 3-like [Ruditapes philippinarum]